MLLHRLFESGPMRRRKRQVLIRRTEVAPAGAQNGDRPSDGFLDPLDRAIVKSITQVGHSLSMQVVAEYVEDQGVFDILMSMGVDLAQGYHIHKPEPLSRLTDNSGGRSTRMVG